MSSVPSPAACVALQAACAGRDDDDLVFSSGAEVDADHWHDIVLPHASVLEFQVEQTSPSSVRVVLSFGLGAADRPVAGAGGAGAGVSVAVERVCAEVAQRCRAMLALLGVDPVEVSVVAGSVRRHAQTGKVRTIIPYSGGKSK